MAYRKLDLIRGDSQTYTITFRDKDGNPFCLKDWKVYFTAKSNYDLPDSSAVFQKIITTFDDTTGGTSGSARIEIEPADTVNAVPGEYDFDIQAVTESDKVFTVMRGLLEIKYDVTRGTSGA